jgi:hypothetical protein
VLNSCPPKAPGPYLEDPGQPFISHFSRNSPSKGQSNEILHVLPNISKSVLFMQQLVVSRFKFGLPLKVTFPLSSMKTLNDLPDLTKNRSFIKLKSYWLEGLQKALVL